MSPRELISAFTWRDGLDFGLLFLLCYSLLKIVRGTRMAPVLLAVAALGLLARLVGFLDLIAIATLLKYFFEYVIILLIVVFRQELRRILLQLGQRLLPGGRRQAAQSAVGELIAGVERLQRSRLGVLVILQGEIDVLDIVSDRGRPIDAPLKADTLVALAAPHPANVAHDGALLIQEFKIARAGVICPLTEQELDPRFGTRHRGAIGVTEETDALVVIASEERGEVRLVQGGVISTPLTVDMLEERIAKWLAQPRVEATRKASDSRVEAKPADLGGPDLSRAELVRDTADHDAAHSLTMATVSSSETPAVDRVDVHEVSR